MKRWQVISIRAIFYQKKLVFVSFDWDLFCKSATKVRTGPPLWPCNRNRLPSYLFSFTFFLVQLKNLSAMEVNIVRPFMMRTLQAFYKHDNPQIIQQHDNSGSKQPQVLTRSTRVSWLPLGNYYMASHLNQMANRCLWFRSDLRHSCVTFSLFYTINSVLDLWAKFLKSYILQLDINQVETWPNFIPWDQVHLAMSKSAQLGLLLLNQADRSMNFAVESGLTIILAMICRAWAWKNQIFIAFSYHYEKSKLWANLEVLAMLFHILQNLRPR